MAENRSVPDCFGLIAARLCDSPLLTVRSEMRVNYYYF